MSSMIERNGKVYVNVHSQIPIELKLKAQTLKINLTQATIAGIEAEIKKKENQGN